MTIHHLVADATATAWEQAIHAFPAENEGRSGSLQPVETQFRMPFYFFGAVGKPPYQVVPIQLFSYAPGKGLSGNKPFLIPTDEPTPAVFVGP